MTKSIKRDRKYLFIYYDFYCKKLFEYNGRFKDIKYIL
jgi:hypothetical protein